jgi:hypothetical protein
MDKVELNIKVSEPQSPQNIDIKCEEQIYKSDIGTKRYNSVDFNSET